jgi:hypothetical protein
VKTVRFSEVVKRCGAPEAHLTLMAPAKDKPLQAAIKAHRVMTVLQQNVGTKTDYGTIGFEEGSSRQYLVFPKSLRTFAGRKVVGIKYELLSSEEPPPRQRARPPKAPKARKAPKSAKVPKPAKALKARKPRRRPAHKDAAESLPSKVVEFPPPAREHDEDEAVRELKRLARRAMQALEEGKHVAAFHLLKRIVAL